MMLGTVSLILVPSMARLAAASLPRRADDPPPPTAPRTQTPPAGEPYGPKIPCPTTLTVPPIRDCSGCTKTLYPNTYTASVDCQGCESLVTTTSYDPFVGLCPVSLLLT